MSQETFQPGDKVIWRPAPVLQLEKRHGSGTFTVAEVRAVPLDERGTAGHDQLVKLAELTPSDPNVIHRSWFSGALLKRAPRK